VSGVEYSVLKEKMKENECGWSYNTWTARQEKEKEETNSQCKKGSTVDTSTGRDAAVLSTTVNGPGLMRSSVWHLVLHFDP
jgi:hypothetical protein